MSFCLLTNCGQQKKQYNVAIRVRIYLHSFLGNISGSSHHMPMQKKRCMYSRGRTLGMAASWRGEGSGSLAWPLPAMVSGRYYLMEVVEICRDR